VAEVRKVMSLTNKDDFFYAWGCFAESRFPGLARDVSRETFLRKKDSAQARTACMFHVKPFSPALLTYAARAMFHVKHLCVRARFSTRFLPSKTPDHPALRWPPRSRERERTR
jgi:hypothetical protein